MNSSAQLISPNPVILEKCHLETTIDRLRIHCSPELAPALLRQIDSLTPCRLEVLRVEIWVDDRPYVQFSVDTLIRSRQ